MDSDLKLDDLSRRRWDRGVNPNDHDPKLALAAAADHVAAKDAEHVIVAIGKRMPDGSAVYTFMQAGNFNHLEQLGLLSAVHGLMSRE